MCGSGEEKTLQNYFKEENKVILWLKWTIISVIHGCVTNQPRIYWLSNVSYVSQLEVWNGQRWAVGTRCLPGNRLTGHPRLGASDGPATNHLAEHPPATPSWFNKARPELVLEGTAPESGFRGGVLPEDGVCAMRVNRTGDFLRVGERFER